MVQRILLAALILVLSPSWWHFPSVWLPSREYGFVALALGLWQAYLARGSLNDFDPEPTALLVLPFLSLLWWASLTANVQVGHLLLTPWVVFAWIGASSGRRAMIAFAPAFLVFMLAIPIWEALNPVLQSLAVLFSRLVLSAAGINATIEGTFIILRTGVIHVADSCSGLHFLMVGLTIAASYAFLFVTRRATRIRVVAVAAALAIVANWIRVVGLVLIGEWSEMRSALLADHDFYGWVIFACALAVFFPIAYRIEKRDIRASRDLGRPNPLANREAAFVCRDLPRSRLYGSFVLAAIGPSLSGILAFVPSEPVAPVTPFANLREDARQPTTAQSGAAWQPRFMGATHRVFASTSSLAEFRVDQYYYARQRQGLKLISEGNYVAPDSQVVARRLVGPLDRSLRTVQETVVRVDSTLVVVWSYYRVGGVETSSSAKARLLQIPAAFRGRTDAEAVLVSAACPPNHCERALRALYVAFTGVEPPPQPATTRTSGN